MEFKPFTLQVLLLLQIIFMPTSMLCLKECNFPAIFNFGDSNSDTGQLSAAFGQLPPTYGRTFFDAPSGRLSDGRLTIDFMAKSLGLPFLSPFLDSIGSNFSHGANFATAGSSIIPYSAAKSTPFSLDVQHAQFSDFLYRSQVAREREFYRRSYPAKEDFGRALYTFDIGQNDLGIAYLQNSTIDQVKAMVPDLLRQFSKVVKLVYDQGGRSFWIHNDGPMGCLKIYLVRLPDTATQFDEYGCFIPYNDVSQYFNLGLKETVRQLREELPETAITYIDIYSIKYNLFSQAKQLGLEDPFRVCCGWGEGEERYNQYFECHQTKVADGTIIYASVCEDPSLLINWDGVHLSEVAHKYIFDQLVDGSFSDPPVALKFACNKDS